MRLFIAITLPPQVKEQLAAYGAELCTLARQARPTLEENFHLTLAFLGQALSPQAAGAALAQLPPITPFKLYSHKPGRFLRGPEQIFWLGLKSSAELTALHQTLAEALKAQGFQETPRPFAPHLTLARQVRGLELSQLPPAPRFILPVTGLSLLNSTRQDNRLVYETLSEIEF